MKETPVDGRGVDPVKHNRPRETWANRRARKARGANAAKLQKDQTLGGEIDVNLTLPSPPEQKENRELVKNPVTSGKTKSKESADNNIVEASTHDLVGEAQSKPSNSKVTTFLELTMTKKDIDKRNFRSSSAQKGKKASVPTPVGMIDANATGNTVTNPCDERLAKSKIEIGLGQSKNEVETPPSKALLSNATKPDGLVQNSLARKKALARRRRKHAEAPVRGKAAGTNQLLTQEDSIKEDIQDVPKQPLVTKVVEQSIEKFKPTIGDKQEGVLGPSICDNPIVEKRTHKWRKNSRGQRNKNDGSRGKSDAKATIDSPLTPSSANQPSHLDKPQLPRPTNLSIEVPQPLQEKISNPADVVGKNLGYNSDSKDIVQDQGSHLTESQDTREQNLLTPTSSIHQSPMAPNKLERASPDIIYRDALPAGASGFPKAGVITGSNTYENSTEKSARILQKSSYSHPIKSPVLAENVPLANKAMPVLKRAEKPRYTPPHRSFGKTTVEQKPTMPQPISKPAILSCLSVAADVQGSSATQPQKGMNTEVDLPQLADVKHMKALQPIEEYSQRNGQALPPHLRGISSQGPAPINPGNVDKASATSKTQDSVVNKEIFVPPHLRQSFNNSQQTVSTFDCAPKAPRMKIISTAHIVVEQAEPTRGVLYETPLEPLVLGEHVAVSVEDMSKDIKDSIAVDSEHSPLCQVTQPPKPGRSTKASADVESIKNDAVSTPLNPTNEITINKTEDLVRSTKAPKSSAAEGFQPTIETEASDSLIKTDMVKYEEVILPQEALPLEAPALCIGTVSSIETRVREGSDLAPNILTQEFAEDEAHPAKEPNSAFLAGVGAAAASQAGSGAGAMCDKGEIRPKACLEYEPCLVDWNGGWAPASVEWDSRSAFNYNDGRHRAFMDAWIDARVKQAINHPFQLNMTDAGFVTGEGPASGLIRCWPPYPVDWTVKLPDDPYTLAHLNQTSDKSSRSFCKKHYAEKKARKEAKAAYKEIIRQKQEEYVPPPNLHIPKANIYIRPAQHVDCVQIAGIYDYYVRNSPIACETESTGEVEWQTRWRAADNESLPFLVAVLRSSNAKHGIPQSDNALLSQFGRAFEQDGGRANERGRDRGFGRGRGRYNRRNNNLDRYNHSVPENIVGFTYAEDISSKQDSLKFTVELQCYVHPGHLHLGIGKTLIDRIMPSLDLNYISRAGTDFFADNPCQYDQGGRREIRRIMITIGYHAMEDEDFIWQKEWLEKSWRFEEAGILRGIGFKFNKAYNIAYLVKETRMVGGATSYPEYTYQERLDRDARRIGKDCPT